MIDTFSIRCGVLRLAFSGKLTDQRDEDGTAPDILNKIDTKKPITEIENGPYSIPASWAWVRLADLYKVNPKVEADDNIEAAFIPMERISGGFDREFTFKTQKWEIASKNHTKFEDGDVAFAKITPCFENRKSFIDNFDPWKYASPKAMLIGMYYTILQNTGVRYSNGQIKELLSTACDIVAETGNKIGRIGAIAKELLSQEGNNDSVDILKSKIDEYLELNNKTILFMIDNLDRVNFAFQKLSRKQR